jgi:sulfite reductase (NADPH) hemoprotein beta-component
MKKPFEPNFNTPDDQLCKEELNKLRLPELQIQMADELRNNQPDFTWEVEQIAKSYGAYLEFNRDIKTEKEWMYMVRISNPAGGPISPEQWLLYDELSEKYGRTPEGVATLRLTTRQNIQFHWASKKGVREIVKSLAERGANSLNGCGDNTRNVMAAPLSRYSKVFNAARWAHRLGAYFQLPVEPWIKVFAIDPAAIRKPEQSYKYGPKLLNRKFKIAVSGFLSVDGRHIPDNSVELLTNEIGVSPVLENGKVDKVQLYAGGSQGERNGKPTASLLGQPLAIVRLDDLQRVAEAIVRVHEKTGDRQNRHWARLKYVIKKMGIEWFRSRVEELIGEKLERPDPDHDIGDRQLYFGWNHQPSDGNWAFGMFVESGRLVDNRPNGRLKTLMREMVLAYPMTEIMITPNQDILFCNIPGGLKEQFEADLKKYGYGQRGSRPYSKLRLLSGACVGLNTCRLSYTDSERFEAELMDQLESMGWGDMKESIGITGCERQCFRPATKTIGLVGSGGDRYMFKLFGDETARYQGRPLISGDGTELYLRSVQRDSVAAVIDALFKKYMAEKTGDEGLGAFLRRLGDDAIIACLKANPATTALMEKPFNTDMILD